MEGGSDNNRSDMKSVFESLFAEYSDVIYRLCLYKTSDQNIASDLTQECFLRLWRALTSQKPIEKPKQYLYQIARNLVIDHYKKMKSLSLDKLGEDGFDPADEQVNVGLPAEIALLKQAIESLEEDYKDVIYLRFVEDMGVGEIAEALKLSPNLVSVRLNRGKKKLQELFL